MDLTGLRSSHGRKNSDTTAVPITTTPQNFDSVSAMNTTTSKASTGKPIRHLPRARVRRLQRVRRHEVIGFEEIAAHFRREENDRGEDEQEYAHAHEVVDGVVRVERDAVERNALFVLLRLDLVCLLLLEKKYVQRDHVGD